MGENIMKLQRKWPSNRVKRQKKFIPTEKESFATRDLSSVSETMLGEYWGEHKVPFGEETIRYVKTKISGVSHFSKQKPNKRRGQLIKDFLTEEWEEWTAPLKDRKGAILQDHILFLLRNKPKDLRIMKTPIGLLAEPENEIDPNAIVIYLKEPEIDIGYLPKGLAALVDLQKQEGIVFHHEPSKNKRNLILWIAFIPKTLMPGNAEYVGIEDEWEEGSVPEKSFEMLDLTRFRKKNRVD